MVYFLLGCPQNTENNSENPTPTASTERSTIDDFRTAHPPARRRHALEALSKMDVT